MGRPRCPGQSPYSRPAPTSPSKSSTSPVARKQLPTPGMSSPSERFSSDCSFLLRTGRNSENWLLLSNRANNGAVLIAAIGRARKFDGAAIFGESFSIDDKHGRVLGQSQQLPEFRCRSFCRNLLNTVLKPQSVRFFENLVQGVFGDIEPLQPRAQPLRNANKFEGRSEERRVGKECRSRWSPYH